VTFDDGTRVDNDVRSLTEMHHANDGLQTPTVRADAVILGMMIGLRSAVEFLYLFFSFFFAYTELLT
jgi:hypothetical protein